MPSTSTTETPIAAPPLGGAGAGRRPKRSTSMFDPAILRRAVRDSFVKLDPRLMARNPVMFVVEVGSVLTTLLFLRDVRTATAADNVFVGLVAAWLWFTVLFANFAEAVAEGRGKAQADDGGDDSRLAPEKGRGGGHRGGRAHPRRRRSHRGHRLGGRISHYR